MDANSARYLVSALIQAVAISWAFVMAFTAIATEGLLRTEKSEDKLSDDEKKSYFKGIKFFIGILLLTSLLSLVTIGSGIYSYFNIEDVNFEMWTVELTVALTILTFVTMLAYLMFHLKALYVRAKKIWKGSSGSNE